MLVSTNPIGSIQTNPDDPGHARLFDFDIDGDQVKPA